MISNNHKVRYKNSKSKFSGRQRKLILLSLVSMLLAGQLSACPSSARGFGGGYHGGAGYRGGFDGMRGGAGDFDGGGFGRGDFGGPDAFASPRDYNADAARSSFADNGVRDWGAGYQRPLASDAGFRDMLRSAPLSAMVGARDYAPALSGRDLAARGADVRQAYRDAYAFRGDWWRRYPGAWWNRYWGDDWAWGWTPWDDLALYWGVSGDDEPTYYDYGDNVSYQGDQVYYGSQPLESTTQYYQSAQTIASQSGGITAPVQTAAGAKDWKPMGIFSLVQGNQTNTTTMFQLAVNKKGKIAGNYYNQLTNEVKSINGSIDKKSMRACWTVAGNSSVVYDTGVANLLKDQSPILVHFSKTNTQQWTLVKLKQS